MPKGTFKLSNYRVYTMLHVLSDSNKALRTQELEDMLNRSYNSIYPPLNYLVDNEMVVRRQIGGNEKEYEITAKGMKAFTLLEKLVEMVEDGWETSNENLVKIPPAHPTAVEKRCTCPEEENNFGQGVEDDEGGFVIAGDCPLHKKLLKGKGESH